jgi:hypothetical protein
MDALSSMSSVISVGSLGIWNRPWTNSHHELVCRAVKEPDRPPDREPPPAEGGPPLRIVLGPFKAEGGGAGPVRLRPLPDGTVRLPPRDPLLEKASMLLPCILSFTLWGWGGGGRQNQQYKDEDVH